MIFMKIDRFSGCVRAERTLVVSPGWSGYRALGNGCTSRTTLLTQVNLMKSTREVMSLKSYLADAKAYGAKALHRRMGHVVDVRTTWDSPPQGTDRTGCGSRTLWGRWKRPQHN